MSSLVLISCVAGFVCQAVPRQRTLGAAQRVYKALLRDGQVIVVHALNREHARRLVVAGHGRSLRRAGEAIRFHVEPDHILSVQLMQ